jgi:mannitol/fructose-specific phosphotransferase system IIA component (Ntr-type)
MEMGVEAYLITIMLGLAGFCTYWFYGRKRVERESALLHLIERITAKELVTGTLESELRGIVLERDEVVLDRFDRIVEKCPVLDIDSHTELNAFFRLAADKLAERTSRSSSEIYATLSHREAEDSTAITPNLALPHIVIDGKREFEILLARCREGIAFSEEAPQVRAVFVLVGTADQRNFYLYALSAIAQVAGAPEFMNRWMRARTPQGLRDVVLLGERLRG